MATSKGGGSTKNGRDSVGRRLGMKKFGGEIVSPGANIVKQRGSTFLAGANVRMAKDYTIFSTVEGKVYFSTCVRHRKRRKIINVSPLDTTSFNAAV